MNQLVSCYNFLILHPIYSGSHVLTLHQVALELVKRGHNVVTIRYKDTHDLRLKRPDHESRNIDQSWTDNTNNINVMSDGSFREIQLTLNNSAGKIPYVTMEEEAKFKIPSEILWSEGTTITTLFKVWNSHGNPWAVVKGVVIIIINYEQLSFNAYGVYTLKLFNHL